ncbi:hypothetical protein HELRODRAFT_177174 [Helobdella robusta]|uniref:Uncharacterized protein n=1 Tax=Helobdella robusta TaxID=6412 RepID=T1FBB5_HELRO|nr:hypothetical protein HELRODRAFT_177174 [Helobdella robusta]ESN98292.1 hypothetical protein HELRODRAFT_177174 [Helobdella robusta]
MIFQILETVSSRQRRIRYQVPSHHYQPLTQNSAQNTTTLRKSTTELSATNYIVGKKIHFIGIIDAVKFDVIVVVVTIFFTVRMLKMESKGILRKTPNNVSGRGQQRHHTSDWAGGGGNGGGGGSGGGARSGVGRERGSSNMDQTDKELYEEEMQCEEHENTYVWLILGTVKISRQTVLVFDDTHTSGKIRKSLENVVADRET